MLQKKSKRLEKLSFTWPVNKNLQTKFSAFRDNKTQMSKHSECLEAQKSCLSHRAKQSNTLSDTLASDLT